MSKTRRYSITLLLGIKGCLVGKVMEKGNNIVVEVEGDVGVSSCPRCNSEEIKAHGKAKPRMVFHGLANGNRVYLAIRRQD